MKENQHVRVISVAKNGNKAEVVIHTTEKGQKSSETRHLIRVNGVYQDRYGNGYNLGKDTPAVANA